MIIAVPTDSPDVNSQIARRFGQAKFYVFYDTRTKTTQITVNPATQSEGAIVVPAIADMFGDVSVVIADQMGVNVLRMLKGKGVKVVMGKRGMAVDLITEYISKK